MAEEQEVVSAGEPVVQQHEGGSEGHAAIEGDGAKPGASPAPGVPKNTEKDHKAFAELNRKLREAEREKAKLRADLDEVKKRQEKAFRAAAGMDEEAPEVIPGEEPNPFSPVADEEQFKEFERNRFARARKWEQEQEQKQQQDTQKTTSAAALKAAVVETNAAMDAFEAQYGIEVTPTLLARIEKRAHGRTGDGPNGGLVPEEIAGLALLEGGETAAKVRAAMATQTARQGEQNTINNLLDGERRGAGSGNGGGRIPADPTTLTKEALEKLIPTLPKDQASRVLNQVAAKDYAKFKSLRF